MCACVCVQDPADFFQSSSVLAYICNPAISYNPANSSQPLLQYLAIRHPAVCNLPILQNAHFLIASSKGQHFRATGDYRMPRSADLVAQIASNPFEINWNLETQ